MATDVRLVESRHLSASKSLRRFLTAMLHLNGSYFFSTLCHAGWFHFKQKNLGVCLLLNSSAYWFWEFLSIRQRLQEDKKIYKSIFAMKRHKQGLMVNTGRYCFQSGTRAAGHSSRVLSWYFYGTRGYFSVHIFTVRQAFPRVSFRSYTIVVFVFRKNVSFL